VTFNTLSFNVSTVCLIVFWAGLPVGLLLIRIFGPESRVMKGFGRLLVAAATVLWVLTMIYFVGGFWKYDAMSH
jgi:hypothetical protein